MRSQGQRLKEIVRRSGVLRPHCAIIIGFSGGPDSLALLALLDALREEWDLKIFAVHVNHGLRPEASEEARHASELASHFCCTYIERKISVPELASKAKIGIEEAGREARYRIFREVASTCRRETGREVQIALGHHADDQAETVLFRILRGTGIHGLAGIPALREDAEGTAIIRPLLGIRREAIEAYIEELSLRPNRDTSNDSEDYTRNRIRHELLPLLEKDYNPSVREALLRLAESASEEDAWMDAMAEEELAKRETGEYRCSLKGFTELPVACQRRMAVLLLKDLGLGDRIGMHLAEELLAVMRSENPSARMMLPKGIEAVRCYDELMLRTRQEVTEAARMPELRIYLLPAEEWSACCSEYPEGSYAAFDADLLGDSEGIHVRTRREGDRIALTVGTKRMHDLLVDRKVPREERDRLLLITKGEEVLWIPGSPAFAHVRSKCAAAGDKVFGEHAARFFAKGRYTQHYRLSTATKRVMILAFESLN